MKYIKVNTYEELSHIGANIVAAQIIGKPDSVLGLATGSSPEGIYKELIRYYNAGEIDFKNVKSVNLDEYVGLDGSSDQSYRYFMNDRLFDHVNIDKNNTFVPDGLTADPVKFGNDYDEMIKKMGGIDLQVLGIGIDGHIGFNEPADFFTAETHEVVLEESTVQVNSRFFARIEDVPKKAITMGMRSIMQAKKILLIANGEKKKEILERAMTGEITPRVPASLLQLHHDVTVIFSER